ncbi:unnamed protein product [Leptidea sinapis]|uniref:phosphoacetylglucosamine mutase n=1 Tax=Leptidea sinapis TaxID=189913 RepID=A0A5E4QM43_9NEOP|nr:unnamed protein product [Leptidea sinapis]
MPPSSLRVVYAFAREMHPKTSDVFIQYGTAGFRTKANLLEHVVYRMGLLAVLRSRVKNGRTIGMMITASHNLEPDNGVKLIDPDGEMLEQSWEEIATRLANVSDNDLESTTGEIIKEVNADMSLKASVFIGMDTRYTSPRLAAAAVHGVIALKGTPKEFGIKIPVAGNYNTRLYVDGANGVGGKKLNIIRKTLEASGGSGTCALPETELLKGCDVTHLRMGLFR